MFVLVEGRDLLSLNWRDGLFGGEGMGWMVAARRLWSAAPCPGEGGDEWCPLGGQSGTRALHHLYQ